MENTAILRGGPVTTRGLVEDLAHLGLRPGATVLVHASLSRLGYVVGGAQAAVAALLELLGPDGTLLVPTFSGDWSDPSGWRAPAVPEAWWPTIRAERPGFDPELTPTRHMGALADEVRHLSAARRSVHPLYSFAAVGAARDALVAHHELGPGLGDGSPLARLYDNDGFVLLLGVGHANNTSLHLAEVRSGRGVPSEETSALLRDGVREELWWDDLDYDDSDFPAIGEAFAATGRQRTGPVGAGTAHLMRQRELVDFAVPWLQENRPPPV